MHLRHYRIGRRLIPKPHSRPYQSQSHDVGHSQLTPMGSRCRHRLMETHPVHERGRHLSLHRNALSFRQRTPRIPWVNPHKILFWSTRYLPYGDAYQKRNHWIGLGCLTISLRRAHRTWIPLPTRTHSLGYQRLHRQPTIHYLSEHLGVPLASQRERYDKK